MKSIPFVFFIACLAGCAPDMPSQDKPDPIGEFRLGYPVVVGKEMMKGPLSRKEDPEKIMDAVKEATAKRLSVYEGSQFYHVAVKIDAYVLGRPGIPLLLSPKSALVMQVTVWDDVKKAKINEKPIQMTVLEGLSLKTFVGSGLTQTAEVQIANLGQAAARRIEAWLRQQHKTLDWFKKRAK